MIIAELYDLLIRPKSADPDIKNREVVLNSILLTIILLSAVMTILSIIFLIAHNKPEHIWRIYWICIILISFSFLYYLSRVRLYYFISAWIIVSLFFGLAIMVVLRWGPINPIASVLFCVCALLASILLGARFSGYVILGTAITFFLIVYNTSSGSFHPDLSWLNEYYSYGDAISIVSLISVVGLTAWLFNHQMEVSMTRARKSEKALRKERDMLEIKVEERTRELQRAQIQKIQEFYRFAELGHLSTAFFHDLANLSSSLSMDVEGLHNTKQDILIKRIQQNIHHINDVVKRVNQHLRSKPKIEKIYVNREVKEIISLLLYSASRKEVSIKFSSSQKDIIYKADRVRFRQLIMNLLSNAVESYDNKSQLEKIVKVSIEKSEKMMVITIQDFGKGVSRSQQARIFEPFYSGKTDGTGIGLFIVKNVVEKDFNGKITFSSNKKDGTTFVVSLPIQ